MTSPTPDKKVKHNHKLSGLEKIVTTIGSIGLIALPLSIIFGVWGGNPDLAIKVAMTALILVLFSGFILSHIKKQNDE